MSLTPACPLRAAEDAVLLFRTGRTAMASVVIEGLPRLILEAENQRLRDRIAELEDVLAERRALLGRLAPQVAVAGKPLAKPHERLAAALAGGRVTAERVAELLKAEPPHVHEIASGRVGLSPTAWKRLMAELEADTP